jgi:hypothetical protein
MKKETQMLNKLMLATALSLSLGTAAIAQTSISDTSMTATDPATGTETAADFGKDWDPAVSGAFYTDDTRTTLRTESEIQSNWKNLSAQQQAQIRTECEGYMAASAGMKTTASENSTSSPATGTAETGSNISSSAPATQLCTYVEAM